MYGAIIFGIYIGGTTLYEKIQKGDADDFVPRSKESLLQTFKKLFKQEGPANQGYEGMG